MPQQAWASRSARPGEEPFSLLDHERAHDRARARAATSCAVAATCTPSSRGFLLIKQAIDRDAVRLPPDLNWEAFKAVHSQNLLPSLLLSDRRTVTMWPSRSLARTGFPSRPSSKSSMPTAARCVRLFGSPLADVQPQGLVDQRDVAARGLRPRIIPAGRPVRPSLTEPDDRELCPVLPSFVPHSA
jgi:hypothetical protein